MGESTGPGGLGWHGWHGWRARLVSAVGAVLLAGGLLALTLPVSLGDYDKFGIQVSCGSGLHRHLVQETVDDQDTRCDRALTLRRAWAIPTTGVGALIIIPNALAWIRRRAEAGSARSNGGWSAAAHRDDSMHEAAVLDRRERSHFTPPSNTTL